MLLSRESSQYKRTTSLDLNRFCSLQQQHHHHHLHFHLTQDLIVQQVRSAFSSLFEIPSPLCSGFPLPSALPPAPPPSSALLSPPLYPSNSQRIVSQFPPGRLDLRA